MTITNIPITDKSVERLRIVIEGAVQGVGFRPFIFRLAAELGIAGWVSNTAQGVLIEAQASSEKLAQFVAKIEDDPPPHSFIRRLEKQTIRVSDSSGFEIRHSQDDGATSAIVLPDMAICPECLTEMFDPDNRRYLYPFTNCTHCGPRYSIIEGLPYDRPATTMRDFVMCKECQAEYENPLDRRFHAQPNACPTCGPQAALWDIAGNVLTERHNAVLRAADVIRRGEILAFKGLGGFHLMVDARNHSAIARLRTLKHREGKPLAVMYPTLERVKADCEVSSLEEQLLTSSEAPIVLLRHREHICGLCICSVAPGNPYRGVMLPYTPLHHLLMAELGFPIVATSGNLSGEPICIDEHEALHRLQGIADAFLVHDRPIARAVDDSIVRVMADRPMLLRRARGYAPLPLELTQSAPAIFATGAHLKNTLAIAKVDQVFISQHIGDMETSEAFSAFKRTFKKLSELYRFTPELVVSDLHPDYRSTQYAQHYSQTRNVPMIQVQHHYAHVLACIGEHKLAGPVLGVAWDGTGYGTDGTIWGGEFLLVPDQTKDHFERIAYLRPFPLPGGERAIEEPRRIAFGLLYELYGDDMPPDLAPLRDFTREEIAILKTAIKRGINTPFTSSIGRLFDGVASLCGLRQRVTFEGQAAMDLEFALDGLEGTSKDERYPYSVTDITDDRARFRGIIEWRPMVDAILSDLSQRASAQQGTKEIAAKFHHTLSAIILDIAVRTGVKQVVLSGGCFQNRTLLESTVGLLSNSGFRVYWPERIPPNDGGIALGQVVAAMRHMSMNRNG